MAGNLAGPLPAPSRSILSFFGSAPCKLQSVSWRWHWSWRSLGASAQPLSSPLCQQAPARASTARTARSRPLQPRADVVPWSVLTDIKTKTDKNKVLPVFQMSQMALNQKTQRIQGFMMPLEPGEKQKHFLLTSVPMTCGFCVPGGPESMVEVRTKTPVAYSLEPVVVEGKFQVLLDDPYGLFYRVTDAASVNG
jgi:hypothetical protein